MFGKASFVAVLMILSAMVFASLKGPRVNDYVANGSENSSSILPSRRPRRIPGIGETGSGMASLGDSSLPGAGGFAPPSASSAIARPAPIAASRPQVAAPPDSSDQQMNNDDNSNDSDSNDNDNNDTSDDRNSNDDNDNNSGDQAMNNQSGDEQSNNPFTQEVPPGMMRTPTGQLMPLVTPPAIAPFPPRLSNN